MTWSSFLRRWLFLGSGTCPVCGRVLFLPDAPMCSRCYEDLPRNDGQTCTQCGRPIMGAGATLCGDCTSMGETSFTHGYSWLKYSGSARPLIQGLKFDGRRDLGLWLGQEMAAALLNNPWASEMDAIIPVPLHANRLAERGYNQSHLIACGIQRGMAEHGVALPLYLEALVRRRDTPHQVGLDRERRLINLEGAFLVAEPGVIAGKHILLVDDVSTTGTTLNACAQVLLLGGAARVAVATVASGS